MKIAVIGGTGLIGTKLSARLEQHGHEVAIAAPKLGVNTLTGEGLQEVVAGAATVVDVSNSPSFEDHAVLEFFTTSTKNILRAAAGAGVGHYVALSVVGTKKLGESGYFRAKIAQEELIQAGSVPYSIVHATQFYEFLAGIADGATDAGVVRLAPVLIQPIAAVDVAATVGRISVGKPLSGIVEVAGPEQFSLDRLVADDLSIKKDPRQVKVDPSARYFGATLTERMLLPGPDALVGSTTIADWRAANPVPAA